MAEFLDLISGASYLLWSTQSNSWSHLDEPDIFNQPWGLVLGEDIQV
jgi:hypothetical protein